jgi:hypothetical protein
MEQWTFLKAFLIAVPFLFLEYQFSLRGNQYARTHLSMNQREQFWKQMLVLYVIIFTAGIFEKVFYSCFAAIKDEIIGRTSCLFNKENIDLIPRHNRGNI